ncbi:hypothetical protein ES703_47691 [subsurface metagenome]
MAKKEQEDLEKIKEKIKELTWDDYSDKYWTVRWRENQYSDFDKIYRLNPKEYCSKKNPLYLHKGWLERVYNNEEWQLTDQMIAKICGVHFKTIGKWRKRNNIMGRAPVGEWKETGTQYVTMKMPEGYFHPQWDKTRKRRIERFKHVVIIERYLSEQSLSEIWKRFRINENDLYAKFLIDGRYLRLECVIHHIDYIHDDNRLENLWPYENRSVHNGKANKSLFKCFGNLIKLNQIFFKNGKYYLNKHFDYRNLSSSEIKEILEPKSINYYKDINNVKRDIKKIGWTKISDDWTIKHSKYSKYRDKKTSLDPYSDCSERNPLYMHKAWVERLIHDKKFNLTDSRLADVSGVEKYIIRYWREDVHNIKGKREWGFGQVVRGERVMIKIPEDYGNPFAKRNDGYMYKYRYIMERHLAKHPELEVSQKMRKNRCLIDGKYLDPECPVHHINLDKSDNMLENLWACKSQSEHALIETSLFAFVDWLLESKRIVFMHGEYYLNY